jgi:hypothetical protein
VVYLRSCEIVVRIREFDMRKTVLFAFGAMLGAAAPATAQMALGFGPADPVASHDGGFDFTMRGGSASTLDIAGFTPGQSVIAGREVGVEARVRAFGFDFGGALLGGPEGQADDIALGASVGRGALSFGGAVSVGGEDGSELANFGVNYGAADGGAVGLSRDADAVDGQGAFSAGVSIRLDF